MVTRRLIDDLGFPLRRLLAALEQVSDQGRDWPLTTDIVRLTRSVRDYLLPRVDDPSRPLTVVFVGPTGAGKSTLLNSIAGAEVSSTGALRPTTRAPVALVAPDHAAGHQVIGGIECKVVVGEAAILETMSLVDTPDLDSTETGHRAIAEALVDHADIVVFVTSALRYADAVPWQVLRRAQARGTEVINVLNRVSPATSGAKIDFRSRLSRAGMSGEVVAVPEHHMPPDAQRVPAPAVRSLRKKLATLAVTRDTQGDETLGRVLATTMDQVAALADEIEGLVERREEFEDELSLDLGSELESIALHGVTAGLHEELSGDGSPLRMARWLRRNRRRPEEMASLETRLANRVTGLIAAEMRRLVGDYELWPGRSAITALVERHVMAELPSAVTGWLFFVHRMAEGHPDGIWSAEAALVESACSGKVTMEAEALFAEKAPELVERVRRQLVSRLQLIGVTLATMVTELVYPGLGEVDLGDLGSAHGALVARLAPVHA